MPKFQEPQIIEKNDNDSAGLDLIFTENCRIFILSEYGVLSVFYVQAEILQLTADYTGAVEASVIEANTHQHLGKVWLLAASPPHVPGRLG